MLGIDARCPKNLIASLGNMYHREAVAAMMAGLMWLLASTLSVNGLDAFDVALLALFAVTLPWSVIGFCNATIGFLIMRLRLIARGGMPGGGTHPWRRADHGLDRDRHLHSQRSARTRAAQPQAPDDRPVAIGFGDRFHVYILSDTSDPAVAAAKDAQFGAFAGPWTGLIPITYRRRESNAGFKTGNVRDFCERWGHLHELAVTLDADSFMAAEAVLRRRVMQANPQLGILQGLVVGMPSTSAFARIFQFGMRTYSIGGAWWQGDCGSAL
jgi:membrane glycosyltransferase